MSTRPIKSPTAGHAAGLVEAFIESAPDAQRATLREIRGMIRDTMPGAVETMSPNHFPVYTAPDGLWLAGFASRKACPMLYVMAPGVLDRFEARLGPLRSGKSCMKFAPTRAVDDAALRAIAREILADAARHLER